MTSPKKTRKTYSVEFKEEILKLAAKVGVAQAARELSIYESQRYTWRSAAQEKASTSERESTLATENAKLKRQLVKQAEELEILKKAAVDSTDHRNTLIHRRRWRLKFQCFSRPFV